MKRKATLVEALIPIFAMLVFLGVGYGYMKLNAEPLLIMAAAVAALVAIRLGCTWDQMQEGIVEKIAKSMPATLILLSVGLLIGTWMASGTIPMMIYYGIKLINPSYIIITSFLVTALVSVFTGTSWGSAGTVGVAMIGIATGLGVSLPATAGAIVAGSYFGDKLSPLSDTTNLAPIAAGSELYEHIRHMLYTTVPAFIISLVVYGFVGKSSVSGTANPEKIGIMLDTLDIVFNWNVLLIVPVIIVLYGSIAKKPTVPIMLISSAVAALTAVIYQGFAPADVFNTMVKGFNISMYKGAGFDAENVIWEVTRLVNRGGIMSMMGTVVIAYCAFAFAGIVSKAGLLEVILERMQSFIKSTGTLIFSTVLACLTMAVVTGSSYLSIIVPGELFADTYKKMKLHAKNLSRTLEDSGTVVVPLVPWSMAGVYMSSTLGVPVLDYAPWAILCYAGFITAIIYGFTGFGIAPADDVAVKKEELAN